MARKPKASTEEKMMMNTKELAECEAELAGIKEECAEAVRQVKAEFADRTKELKTRVRKLKKEQKDLENRKSREEMTVLMDKIQAANLSPEEVNQRLFGSAE